jgi:UDP-2-acetamido-2,6-beta-L-arabino-hexul-4-ose reductase
MKILVTGSSGFIGKNLVARLGEQSGNQVLRFDRGQASAALLEMIGQADAIVHLAGANRPREEEDFINVNIRLTEQICQCVKSLNKKLPLVFASTSQAILDNPYGRSKLAAERCVQSLSAENGNPIAIFRLPGVFGKWCKPNYNSVVATFCFNKSRDLPVTINNRDACLRLIYIDDLIERFISQLFSVWSGTVYCSVTPEYNVSLGELADQIDAFRECQSTLSIGRVGIGFTRALYATYMSYIPVENYLYSVPVHRDDRGIFVEMLKTQESGQLSFFTAHVGVTRGGHYHNTKTEKFMVVKGRARFRFRNILTEEIHTIETSGDHFRIVETVPGWAHDITNVGDEEMLVMLWANEVFNQKRPDTITTSV